MKDVQPGEALDDLIKPYTIVTSSDGKQSDAMTTVWASQVSFDPPMVMISVGKKRKTHELIENSGEFVVNTLRESQKKVADYCGHASLKSEDKLKEQNIEVQKASKVMAPLLKGSPSALECKVFSRQDCGDHTVFIGEVVAAHKEEGTPVGLFKNDMVMPGK
ncbi:flavin reductase family protein [Methanocella arvoryzae]|uniref:Flavoredoxin n=1 Tax=Methanocella arvoryzae (strain DSM 22066 / NBRC 105507 / MRE50) TaxID=351160 RepID=Q0W3X7_METAR|nr:flavin reductase family protein [Methanocella arvoryzae]CAJ36916.2 putative flavoredoxin [Methanocella arvoryzae MRE50]